MAFLLSPFVKLGHSPEKPLLTDYSPRKKYNPLFLFNRPCNDLDAMKIEREIRRGGGEEMRDERSEIVAEAVDRIVELLGSAEDIDDENAPMLLRLLAPSFGPRPDGDRRGGGDMAD